MDGTPRRTASSFGDDIFNDNWLAEALRVAAEDSCLFMFTRWDVLAKWVAALQDAGWTVVQRLIWDKRHWGMGDLRYYGSQTEDVLFCRKGVPILHWNKRRGNIFPSPSKAYFPEGVVDHPAQKPEGVLEKWITDASLIGDLVFDPFLGSGTTAVAAKKLDRCYFGCDISQEYVDMANKRLAQIDGIQLPLQIGS